MDVGTRAVAADADRGEVFAPLESERKPRASGRFFFAAVAGILILGAVLRVPSLAIPIWNMDESVSAVMGDAILNGGTVYHDAVDHRGPVTYFVYALIFKVFGRDNMVAIHLSLMVVAAAITLMIIALGLLIGLRAGALFAGLLFALSGTIGALGWDVYAFHTEWIMIAFTTAAALSLLRALRGGFRLGWMLISGICCGLAFWTKQPSVMDVIGMGLFVLFAILFEGDGPPKQRIRECAKLVAVMFAGFAAVGLMFVAYFLHRGAWKDFVFYFWTYNSRYYVAASSWRDRTMGWYASTGTAGRSLGLCTLAAAGAFLILTSRRRNGDGTRSPWLLFPVFWGVFSFVGSCMSGRSFGHYFLETMPSWCLLAGVIIEAVGNSVFSPAPASGASDSSRRNAVALVAACLLVPGIFPVVAQVFWDVGHIRAFRNSPENLSAAFIRNNSLPSDRIFVWGFDPDIYVLSHRRPASRYTFCNFLVGLVPWLNTAPDINTDRWIVPGSMDTLMGDLQSHLPLFIVDTSPGDINYYGKYPISRYEPLARLLADRYEPDARFNRSGTDAVRVYRLTDPAAR